MLFKVEVKTVAQQWVELISENRIVEIEKFEKLATTQKWYSVQYGDSHIAYVDNDPLEYTITIKNDSAQPWRGYHTRKYGMEKFPANWEVFTINGRTSDLGAVVARNNHDGTVTVYRQK